MSDAASQFQQDLWRAVLASGILKEPGEAIKDAFFASPRHHFVKRYRPWREREWSDIGTGSPELHLPKIYEDEPIVLQGDSDFHFESSCSQPSFILNLAAWLDVQPGHNVLEIGSGCGWLLAILSHLAGPSGHITGVEIIDELAELSRRNLADHRNIAIHAGDGNQGYAANAPYDRIIFTTGLHDLPSAFYDQIKPGGRLLAPVRMAGHGNVIHLFERDEAGFMSVRAMDGYFVPMKGQPAEGDIQRLQDLPFWKDLETRLTSRRRMWWGTAAAEDTIRHAAAFRSVLKILEPETRGYDLSGLDGPLARSNFAFGLVFPESACLVHEDGLLAYGEPEAAERVMEAMRSWLEYGMPPGSAFPLKLVRGGGDPKLSSPFADRRGDSVFLWEPPADTAP